MKPPVHALSLKQFMVRREVLQLYRDFLRCVRRLPTESDRKEWVQWVRDDFRSHKDIKDEEAIKMMLTRGKMQLREFQKMANLSS